MSRYIYDPFYGRIRVSELNPNIKQNNSYNLCLDSINVNNSDFKESHNKPFNASNQSVIKSSRHQFNAIQCNSIYC